MAIAKVRLENRCFSLFSHHCTGLNRKGLAGKLNVYHSRYPAYPQDSVLYLRVACYPCSFQIKGKHRTKCGCKHRASTAHSDKPLSWKHNVDQHQCPAKGLAHGHVLLAMLTCIRDIKNRDLRAVPFKWFHFTGVRQQRQLCYFDKDVIFVPCCPKSIVWVEIVPSCARGHASPTRFFVLFVTTFCWFL